MDMVKFQLPDTWRTHRPPRMFGESKLPDPIRVQFIHGTMYPIADVRVCAYHDGHDGDTSALTLFLEHPDAPPGTGFGFMAEHFDITPRRTQRTRKSTPGIPAGSVYVGRPTQWGNPAVIGGWFKFERVHDNRVAVSMFYDHCKNLALAEPEQFAEWLKPLIDRNLCCWCSPGDACHADVLLALARHLKPILNAPDFRTLIPVSVKTWPEISCIIVL